MTHVHSIVSFFSRGPRWLVLLLVATWPVVANGAETNRISFNKEIQPILSEYCYQCHGPDSSTRKPKNKPLRLDRAQFAFEPRGDGKPVIVKGNPGDSSLLQRIVSKDEDEIMPPPASHKVMKPADIALLQKWVEQGGNYEEHWAFVAPDRTTPPEERSHWAKNPIDHFVAAKLRENGLHPGPEERKARLFRRLSFDLTGLPPSLKELNAFINNRSPKAYEAAVDRMLGTDASAEHFARYWLDAVRYADTQGIHHDHSRSIWLYRDWVINAFKANMPFDQFTLEQIAGDMLPRATTLQKVASGYNRVLPTTGEGGAIEEEYKAIYAKDRVDTTAAVWLGLTTGCASCHDHKFDPISTKEFYSLTAFFRNSTVQTLDSGKDGETAPLLFVPASLDEQRWPQVERAFTNQMRLVQERKAAATNDFVQWLSSKAARQIEAPRKPALLLPLDGTNGSFSGIVGKRMIQWQGSNDFAAGISGSAPRLTGGVVSGAAPHLTRHGKASYGAFVWTEGKPMGAILSRMEKTNNHRGWDLFLTDGKPTVHIADNFPDSSLKVTAKTALPTNQWNHLFAVYDGTIKGSNAISLYVNGQKIPIDVNNNSLGSNITANVPFRLGGRSDKEGAGDTFKNGKVFAQDVRFYDRALNSREVAQLAASKLVPYYVNASDRASARTNIVFPLYLALWDRPYQKLQAELEPLQKEADDIRHRGATTLIMEEKKDSAPIAHVLTRGAYNNKGEQVSAGLLEALPPLASGLPTNRVGLARWIASRENPLTARVTANRVWGYLFGQALVETTEDFGVMGSRPTHPELLDWLAVEFMESGWDFRHLVKTMVMSSTYRQSAVTTPETLARDPLNRLLSRGPRFRLEAEQIRDQALASSGLLVRKVGGPSVKPYQAEGVWEAVAMPASNTRNYQQDNGDALYRRSVYTYWKRTAPPANLEILNAPSREVFCTRRERSNTPLQALVTMNDPQFLEAARHLATVAMQESRSFDKRLDRISTAVVARRLSAEERDVVHRLHSRALEQYRKDNDAASALLQVGDSEPNKRLDAAELAAWSLVASQIINLDEALTK